MAELAINVWAPRVSDILIVHGYCKAVILLTHLDLSVADVVHADLLRCAEHSELACTPQD